MAKVRPEPVARDGASRPSAGWSRVYAVVAVSALAVMALLWWFTATYNIPLPAAR